MVMMMMMTKERRDIRPLLVKFGVALALSFAGFLYSRIRTKRIKPSDPPVTPLPPPLPDSERKADHGGRIRIREDPQPELDFVPIDAYDKPCVRVRVDSSSMNASPSGRIIGDKDRYLLPEFDQLVEEFNVSTAIPAATSPGTETLRTSKEPPKAIRSLQQEDYEQEIENLKRKIRILRERERNLEVQLLEYYGLKEQETTLMELQNRLKISNIEAKLSTMKIESLQTDNKRLEAQVADHSRVVVELEAAKAKIKLLKRKIRYESEQNKEKILDLRERVAKLQDHEHEASTSGSGLSSDVRRMKDLEAEAEELKKSNENLQKENSDLARRLESTQILANCLLEDPEKEELTKEKLQFMEENENLTKDVERLKADRCADAEELVYLRWINACLSYELRHYQPPPGKTVARDLSKSLSPTSEAKAKQLILEYANTEDGEKVPNVLDFVFENWPSSNPSYLTDSVDHDESPRSGSSNKQNTKRMKFFAKLRRLIRGKHAHHHTPHHIHHHHHQKGRSFPIHRSLSVDDIGRKYSLESPRRNSSCSEDLRSDDQKSEQRSPRLASSSQNSNNSSLEHHQLSSLAEEDTKGFEIIHGMSDSGSSPGGGIRFVLGRSSSTSPLDCSVHGQGLENSRNSDLAKYAEVLRESHWLQRMHKKSASFSAV